MNSTNRLIHETSPYLLQHAHNPVDWYPWGEQAFEAARAANKPVFLSVGYSACHWCHVMERESFENAEIARVLNHHFINVKVDREERPDVDQVYMAAVQALSGHGGWPMSVFLTPDARPFFAGTYFPPEDRGGMAGFPRVLHAIADAWQNRRAEILAGAERITSELGNMLTASHTLPGQLDKTLLDSAYRSLDRAHDPRFGGFGDAPKFPHPMDLKLLLRHHARTGEGHALEIARFTLDQMARGGIYDHLGGGFARYSTDARWLVPHFEKMLYDNALLASVYVEAFQITHEPFFGSVARETLDYLISRMTDPSGGVYATEDADSEGVEGKYYVWTLDEIVALLGQPRADTFARVYDVTEHGNWEHRSILHLALPIDKAAEALNRAPEELQTELSESRRILREARERRVPPAKDTKILAAWNGLAIAVWADAARVLDEPRYLAAAQSAAGFVLNQMRDSDGRLFHNYKDGRATIPAFLDDYACLIDGFTRLYEASGKLCWIDAATELAGILLDEFQDSEGGGFFYTGHKSEALIVRARDPIDNATPSGNGMAATALLRLADLTNNARYEQAAIKALESVRGLLLRAPSAAGQSLIALDYLLGPREQIALVAGDDQSEFRAALHAISRRFAPGSVLAPCVASEPDASAAKLVPLLEGRAARQGRATAYVCRHSTCGPPLVGLEAIKQGIANSSARPSQE